MDAPGLLETIADEVERHINTLARIGADPYARSSIDALGVGTHLRRAIAAMHAAQAGLRTTARVLTRGVPLVTEPRAARVPRPPRPTARPPEVPAPPAEAEAEPAATE